MRRLLIFLTIVSTVTACASSPPRAQRSEFDKNTGGENRDSRPAPHGT